MRGGRRRTSATLTFGDTWLGRRFVTVLEQVGDTTPYRLDRGRALARQGTVADFAVHAGRMEAVVRDRTALAVTIEVPVLEDADWERAVTSLTSELRHGAEMMSGRVTEDVERVIGAAGVELLPEPAQVVPSCPCVDELAWCRHATAVAYRFADEVDADPFLYTALRGRTRSLLVDALRAARSGVDASELAGLVNIADLDAATFTTARGELGDIAVHPAPPDDPTALLVRLGAPPDIDAERMGPFTAVVARAAETAWRLAAGLGSDVADDELLLAELRARRMAGAGDVAAGLGWAVDRTTQALDRLFAEGIVMKTGKGETARYRA